MSRIRTFIGQHTGRVMTVGAAAVVAGAIAAPLATGANEGSTLKGGQRNGTFSSETKVIANNGNFGTRQSNLGSGGGAIYGCRAANAGRGCIEASNLNNGQAFNFRFRGGVGGTITTNATTPAAQAQAKPLITNATGVATGLNADRVDDMHAQEIIDAAVAKAQPKTAIVGANGSLGTHRGIAASVREDEGKYLIKADADISKCVPTATAFQAGANGANVALEPVDNLHLRIYTQTNTGTQADRQFSLAINC
ncbi:MAG: hypothetical protein ITG02_15930 [Patulibacter sp.]|nr:hypothetical protein [Patulibacter sp.]